MLLDLRKIDPLINLWLDEDVNYYDLTAKIMVDDDAVAKFAMNAREPIVLSGLKIAEMIFRKMDPDCTFKTTRKDGERVDTGEAFAIITGNAQSLLTAERVALNFLCHMSGVASLTRSYVEAVKDTGVEICDTRKTLPGLRLFQKYAVWIGGGANHRFGLDDAILIKDNHIAAVGGISEALDQAKLLGGHTQKIEIEVDNLAQLEEVLENGKADIVMLDNFDFPDLKKAVEMVNGALMTEASGGVSLETVRAIAETGVDVISIGALTHSAPQLDLALDIDV